MININTFRIKYLLPVLIFNFFVSFTYSQEIANIPINSERNITLVTVIIGDIEIPNILLDSGFPFDGIMIYNPDYSDSIDLTGAVQVQIGGAGKDSNSRALMLDNASFLLGNIEMKNQRLIFLQGDLYKGFPSNGITGYSIFGHYVTGFDYEKNVMTLYEGEFKDSDNTWTEIPLYFKDNNVPWVDASVVIKDEEPVLLSMYIDYAARDVILLLEKQDMKFSLPEETKDVYIGRGLSGDIYGKTGYISKIMIGPYEFMNVQASFAPAEVRSKQKNADAVLGNGLFKRFHTVFDYKNKKLYLKPNKYFSEPF